MVPRPCRPWRRKRPWGHVAGLLLLIVLALVGAYLLGDANSGEESEGEGEAAVACSGDPVTRTFRPTSRRSRA